MQPLARSVAARATPARGSDRCSLVHALRVMPLPHARLLVVGVAGVHCDAAAGASVRGARGALDGRLAPSPAGACPPLLPVPHTRLLVARRGSCRARARAKAHAARRLRDARALRRPRRARARAAGGGARRRRCVRARRPAGSCRSRSWWSPRSSSVRCTAPPTRSRAHSPARSSATASGARSDVKRSGGMPDARSRRSSRASRAARRAAGGATMRLLPIAHVHRGERARRRGADPPTELPRRVDDRLRAIAFATERAGAALARPDAATIGVLVAVVAVTFPAALPLRRQLGRDATAEGGRR